MTIGSIFTGGRAAMALAAIAAMGSRFGIGEGFDVMRIAPAELPRASPKRRTARPAQKPGRSRYRPHQGPREKARRVRQMAKRAERLAL